MDSSKFISDSDFHWLMLATKECEEKPWMECIHVIDGLGYTTDGHRMHVAPTTLDNGVYDGYMCSVWACDRDDVGMPEKLDLKARFDGWYNRVIGHGKTVLLSDMVNTSGFKGRVDTKCGTAGAQRNYIIQALFGMNKGEDTAMNFGLLHGGENMFCGTDGQRSFAVMGLKKEQKQ